MKNNRIWLIALGLILVGGILGVVGYASGASTGVRWDRGGIRAIGGRNDLLEMSDTYDTVSSITIDHDVGNVTLEPSYDGSFGYSLQYNDDIEPIVDYSDGKLRIVTKAPNYNGWGSFGFNIGPFSGEYENNLTVYYPEGAEFYFGDIQCALGQISIDGADFERLTAEADMGQITVKNVNSGKTVVIAHMGKVELYGVTAGAADITANMGAVECRDVSLSGNSSIELSMGALNYRGTVSGELNVEANMGAVELRLEDGLDNYDFDLDCDMGSVYFGGREMGGDYTSRSSAANLIKVKSNMGAIKVSE
ncbi:MAG: DUF4097 domain-containing protein [Oscillospiraceae bacterium]|jgi:hypothetical protein|nr:DUF4097 domain-containing protein [Oscillospiraceae bacterium]